MSFIDLLARESNHTQLAALPAHALFPVWPSSVEQVATVVDLRVGKAAPELLVTPGGEKAQNQPTEEKQSRCGLERMCDSTGDGVLLLL